MPTNGLQKRQKQLYFNSNMVRLNVSLRFSPGFHFHIFQFQYGSIKWGNKIGDYSKKDFNSNMVRLNEKHSIDNWKKGLKTYFNSNMVRLNGW